MLFTTEMRWFFADCPLDIELHFSDARSETDLQQRTDWYSMPCNPACGIKVREGKLEMKLRAFGLGQQDMSPFSGHLEAWQKWSFDFPDREHPEIARLESAKWIAVGKRRRLQRFAVDEHRVTRVAERPVNGCEFELTELSVDGSTHWTVGFEAVGDERDREHNLRAVAARVIARGGLRQPFTTNNSYGYAQWLSHLK